MIDKSAIEAVYMMMLGRPPDEVGLDTYLKYAADNNISNIEDIAKLVSQSDEFKFRHYGRRLSIWDNIVTVEYMGINFDFPSNDFTAKDIILTGAYEPYVSRHLFANLVNVNSFVDVGANLGLFSLPISRALGEKGHVYAFEASSKNANLLQQNAWKNNINNITIFPVALGDYNGVAFSRYNDDSSNRNLDKIEEKSTNVEIMPIVSFDSFWDVGKHIDMMKIDIEGFEYLFFKGAAHSIARIKPKMYIEYSDQFQFRGSGVRGEILLSHILSIGYSATILHRNAPPEVIKGNMSEVIEKINGVLNEHIERDGGSHLDLYFEA